MSVERMVVRVTTVVGWCLCLAVCQVKGSYGPADMNRTIQNLLDHYVSTGGGLGGAPLERVCPRRLCDVGFSGGAVKATRRLVM